MSEILSIDAFRDEGLVDDSYGILSIRGYFHLREGFRLFKSFERVPHY